MRAFRGATARWSPRVSSDSAGLRRRLRHAAVERTGDQEDLFVFDPVFSQASAAASSPLKRQCLTLLHRLLSVANKNKNRSGQIRFRLRTRRKGKIWELQKRVHQIAEGKVGD